jgi:hypothetical protein
MDKVYPQEVRIVAENYVDLLREDGFFDGEDFTTTTYAEKYIKDVLLEKFLVGTPLDLGDDNELNLHLDRIITGSIFYELKEDGYMDSYEDEDTKEVFFLTEKGRKLSVELKNKIV